MRKASSTPSPSKSATSSAPAPLQFVPISGLSVTAPVTGSSPTSRVPAYPESVLGTSKRQAGAAPATVRSGLRPEGRVRRAGSGSRSSTRRRSAGCGRRRRRRPRRYFLWATPRDLEVAVAVQIADREGGDAVILRVELEDDLEVIRPRPVPVGGDVAPDWPSPTTISGTPSPSTSATSSASLSKVVLSQIGAFRTALNPRNRDHPSMPTICSTPPPSRSPVSTAAPKPPAYAHSFAPVAPSNTYPPAVTISSAASASTLPTARFPPSANFAVCHLTVSVAGSRTTAFWSEPYPLLTCARQTSSSAPSRSRSAASRFRAQELDPRRLAARGAVELHEHAGRRRGRGRAGEEDIWTCRRRPHRGPRPPPPLPRTGRPSAARTRRPRARLVQAGPARHEELRRAVPVEVRRDEPVRYWDLDAVRRSG